MKSCGLAVVPRALPGGNEFIMVVIFNLHKINVGGEGGVVLLISNLCAFYCSFIYRPVVLNFEIAPRVTWRNPRPLLLTT